MQHPVHVLAWHLHLRYARRKNKNSRERHRAATNLSRARAVALASLSPFVRRSIRSFALRFVRPSIRSVELRCANCLTVKVTRLQNQAPRLESRRIPPRSLLEFRFKTNPLLSLPNRDRNTTTRTSRYRKCTDRVRREKFQKFKVSIDSTAKA